MDRSAPTLARVKTNANGSAGRAETSIVRAISVIELLAERPRTASEIARATGVNRSTALRMLRELESTGYVARHVATKRYSTVAARILALVTSHDDHADWSEAIDPVLAGLRDESGEATMFAVPANGTMVYFAYFPSVHLVTVREHLGTVRPMHASALGKAYLSALPPAALDIELTRLSFEGGTPAAARGPIELRDRLEITRDMGYAVDRDETFDGVSCVAAAVRIGSTLVGAIGASGPSPRFTDTRVAEVGDRIATLARVTGGGRR